MSTILPPLHDYATSRRLLLAQCEHAGATLGGHRHPRTGPGGEPLHLDTVRFGAPPGEARSVVVVASGTHGVEGHGGWGLQRLLLSTGWLGGLPAGTAVVVLHAVNPFGMAWSRRVDHDNIDVNRNFVDFDGPLPANPRYAEVDALVNPEHLDLADTSWQAGVLEFTARVGGEAAFRALSGGQYDHPRGVQYGGQGPSWSRRVLTAVWREQLAGAATVIYLDIHTGLGPCGGLTLFQTADADDAAAHAGAEWFPSVLRSNRPGTTDPLQVGLTGPGLEAVVAEVPLVVPVTVEFGTQDIVPVFSAMRADNWLHQHGDPASPAGQAIRAAMRDAFFVDDDGWRRTVAEQGLATIRAALDALSAPTGGG
jgi:predicted deacylase